MSLYTLFKRCLVPLRMLAFVQMHTHGVILFDEVVERALEVTLGAKRLANLANQTELGAQLKGKNDETHTKGSEHAHRRHAQTHGQINPHTHTYTDTSTRRL